MKSRPNYNNIYKDLIKKQFPKKVKELSPLLAVEITSSLQVIEINEVLFSQKKKGSELDSRKFRSYDVESILKILKYQEDNFFNNREVSSLFKISRNTLASWKKKKELLGF